MASPSLRKSTSSVAGSAASASRAPASDASSLKRKRGSEMKFYAVRSGVTPGVYQNWNDCLQQVTGFKGAIYKSFATLTDAEAFVKGQSKAPTGSARKFYAVAQGRVPGVYEDWGSAMAQITGWQKPVHKSFSTRLEAEAFIKNQGMATLNGSSTNKHADGTDGAAPPKSKKAKNATTIPSSAETNQPVSMEELTEPGWDPLPADAIDGFDNRVKLDEETGKLRYKTAEEMNAMIPRAKINPESDMLHIYTDGACRNNGKQGAIAGVGVWFGRDDPRNISEPLAGSRQTNQRAELTACKRALDTSPLTRPVTIYTDSNYSYKCLTEWFHNWEKNKWLNASKKPVENKDLIEECLRWIRQREKAGAKTHFVWVKGHADNFGNNEADKLAVDGAVKAKH